MIIYPTKTNGTENIFCITSGYGDMLALAGLAQYLSPSDNFYCLQPPATIHTLKQLIETYAAAILQVGGVTKLMGYSIGGVVAFATAQFLIARGHGVPQVILLDSPFQLDRRLYHLMQRGSGLLHMKSIQRLLPTNLKFWTAAYGDDATVMQVKLTFDYRPTVYAGDLIYLQAQESLHPQAAAQWQQVAKRHAVLKVPGNHYSFIRSPHAIDTMASLNEYVRIILGPGSHLEVSTNIPRMV
jgi:thioesterase domain-containing protein